MNEVIRASVVNPKKIEGLVKCEIENRLKHMFNKSQIAAILDEHKVSKWSDDDIAEAFTLRSLSSKCYEYLRTKKNLSSALQINTE